MQYSYPASLTYHSTLNKFSHLFRKFTTMQKSSGYTEREGKEKRKEKKVHLEVVYHYLIYSADIKANIQQIQKRVPGAPLSSSLGMGIQLLPLDTYFRVRQWKNCCPIRIPQSQAVPVATFLVQLGLLSFFLSRQRGAEQAPLHSPAGPYTSLLQPLFLVPFSWAAHCLTCFMDFPGQQTFPLSISNTISFFKSA